MSIEYLLSFVGTSGNKRRREPEGFGGDEGSFRFEEAYLSDAVDSPRHTSSVSAAALMLCIFISLYVTIWVQSCMDMCALVHVGMYLYYIIIYLIVFIKQCCNIVFIFSRVYNSLRHLTKKSPQFTKVLLGQGPPPPSSEH